MGSSDTAEVLLAILNDFLILSTEVECGEGDDAREVGGLYSLSLVKKNSACLSVQLTRDTLRWSGMENMEKVKDV